MSLWVVVVVMALVWLAFRERPGFRRWLGFRPFSRTETLRNGAVGGDELVAGLVARSGSWSKPSETDGRSVHRVTWGAKLVSFSLSALLIWLMIHPPQAPEGMTLVDDPIPGGAIEGVLIVLSISYSWLFTWKYRLEIDDDTLSVMGLGLRMRDYPLSGLVRIEEEGPYAWRMRFADGRHPHALKTVVGSAGLRQRLADVLETNKRG